ncbi:15520_t:CDS:2 [Cetraspora pellucida]|uniref:15520_t:CDS:1 n=1 Tax=Cetraspora pellucida TaxID=1433469 RepID=A0A9N9DUK0_9GLOM|nr:15520_t:CDS:2 [Cetraspora pellucida]
MPKRTRSKRTAVVVPDSEHHSGGSGIDDESIPKYQAQVVITNEPFILNEDESLSENGDLDQQNDDAKGEKDMYQPTSSEEESEELSDSSEYSPKRRLSQRHVTSKRINYSDDKYYKKVHKVFDDFYEQLSSEEESTSRKQRKPNNDDPSRPKRRPRRKSAKKSVDYDEKGYYKKFETALNARLAKN